MKLYKNLKSKYKKKYNFYKKIWYKKIDIEKKHNILFNQVLTGQVEKLDWRVLGLHIFVVSG